MRAWFSQESDADSHRVAMSQPIKTKWFLSRISIFKLVLNQKDNALLNVHELDVVLSPVIYSVWFVLPAEDWKAVNEELQKSCRYVIKNQTTGDRLKIRVVAVNAGGRSPPVTLPEAVLVKEVAGKKS